MPYNNGAQRNERERNTFGLLVVAVVFIILYQMNTKCRLDWIFECITRRLFKLQQYQHKNISYHHFFTFTWFLKRRKKSLKI